jgi:hypothetical protein
MEGLRELNLVEQLEPWLWLKTEYLLNTSLMQSFKIILCCLIREPHRLNHSVFWISYWSKQTFFSVHNIQYTPFKFLFIQICMKYHNETVCSLPRKILSICEETKRQQQMTDNIWCHVIATWLTEPVFLLNKP